LNQSCFTLKIALKLRGSRNQDPRLQLQFNLLHEGSYVNLFNAQQHAALWLFVVPTSASVITIV